MKGKKNLWWYVCWLAWIAPWTWAQALPPDKPLSQFLIQTWTQTNGLPHSTITDILQDSEGYLWIGTNNGLVRFDNHLFEVFYKDQNKQSTLRSSRIQRLLPRQEGGLWVGTLGGGLTRVQQGFFRSLTTQDGLADNAVLCLAYHEKDLWVGTTFGLSLWDGLAWKTFKRSDGLPSDRIESLSVTKDGIWVGTEAGLCQYRDGRLQKIKLDLPHPTITQLLPVSDSVLWIGTRKGLIAWNHRQNTTTQLRNTFVTSLYRDSYGTCWVGTQGEGLLRYNADKQNFDRLDIDQGLPANHVRAIFEDREGGLWLGFERAGLARLRDGKFDNYDTTEGLPPTGASLVIQTPQGDIWAGTTEGLFALREGAFVPLLSDKIRSMTRDAAGSIWIGTATEGLFGATTRDDLIPIPAPAWVGQEVTALDKRQAGGIWLAGQQGVGYYAEQQFTLLIPTTELYNTEVNDLHQTQDGTLWIATSGGGVHAYRANGNLLSFSTEDGLPSNVALCLWSIPGEETDQIFVGTESGLALVREEQIIDLSGSDPLLSRSIYGMIADEKSQLWMSTNRGIVGVAYDELLREEQAGWVIYDEGDGMRSSDCAFGMQPNLVIDQDDKLWIPTNKGLSSFNLREIPINQVPPSLKIHTLIVDGVGNDVRWRSQQKLRFKTDRRRFVFQFDAISFEAVHRIKTRYRLEGFEEDWHQTVGEPQAIYTNLPVGTYTFRFTAANADGIWNLNEASISLEIVPFFYETKLFWSVILLSIIALALGIYRFDIQRLKRKEQRLTQQVEGQIRDAIQREQLLRAQDRELAQVDRIAHIINQEVSFETLFQVLLEQGTGLFEGAKRGFFTTFDEKNFHFELIRHYGFDPDLVPEETVNFGAMMNYCHRGEESYPKEHLFLVDNTPPVALFGLPAGKTSLVISLLSEGVLEALIFFEYDSTPDFDAHGLRKILRFREYAITAFEKSRHLKEIEEKNTKLEDSFQRLSDSIQYAKRIQYAIMPPPQKIISYFEDAFVMYYPKDVVSGDFYWSYQKNNLLFLAAIDCTGHGVPGAFMTVMANTIINNVVERKGLENPGEILSALDEELAYVFSASAGSAKRSDGMDMSLVVIDKEKEQMQFAGAKNPLYYIRDQKINRIKGSKFPIGNADRYKDKQFDTHTIAIVPGDQFYIFTDGLPDQFGGDDGSKFLSHRFRGLLEEFSYLSMAEQKEILEKAFKQWKGSRPQTDDVLVIGMRF